MTICDPSRTRACCTCRPSTTVPLVEPRSTALTLTRESRTTTRTSTWRRETPGPLMRRTAPPPRPRHRPARAGGAWVVEARVGVAAAAQHDPGRHDGVADAVLLQHYGRLPLLGRAG